MNKHIVNTIKTTEKFGMVINGSNIIATDEMIAVSSRHVI
jgi:hypothetical protein